VTLKNQGRDLINFGPNISKRAGDRDLVTMEEEWKVGHKESNGYVTDDVT